MQGSGMLIYLLEADVVCALFADWPADMQVAVCLDPDGGCDLAIHHHDEVPRVLERLAALHRRGAADLCVVPPVDGYETRSATFSQEQQVMALVAAVPQLGEMAFDYALNLQYAREQGVEVDALLGAAEPPEPDLPEADPAPAETLPRSAEAQLESDGAMIRLSLTPRADRAEGGGDQAGGFPLPRSVLDLWSPDQPALIGIPAALLPAELLALCRKGACRGVVSVSDGGVVFLAEASAQAEPALKGRLARRAQRIFSPMRSAAAALVALMLVSGHFATAGNTAPQRVEAVGPPDRGAEAALEVLAEMALADAVSWMPAP